MLYIKFSVRIAMHRT